MNEQQARKAAYDKACEEIMWLRRDIRQGSNWRHVRSGGRYFVNGLALREKDLAILVIYTKVGYSQIQWVRPAKEFLDGRFVEEKE